MTEDQDAAAGVDPNRYLNRARAALREAAEHLDDAAAAGAHPSLGLASAISHVGAARQSIQPYGPAEDGKAPKANAA